MVVSAAVALLLAVFVAALWLPNTLEAEPGAAVVALALAVPILPVAVSSDQPVHSDTTTEATARLLLGHTNSAHGETNR